MSTLHSNKPVSVVNHSIAATLRRLAVWLETPAEPARARTLPRDLEDAEPWLLDDLGLADADDGAPPRASVGSHRQN